MSRHRVRGVVVGVLALGVAAFLLIRLPQLVGTTWGRVGAQLWDLHPRTLAVLSLVWFVSMLAYTLVQVSALPGLAHGRALLMNFSSSAIASGVPGGGALSLANNWYMLRAWGFSNAQFTTYTLMANLAIAAGKLCLPILGALAGVLLGVRLPGWAGVVVATCAAVLVLGAVGIRLAGAASRRGAWLPSRPEEGRVRRWSVHVVAAVQEGLRECGQVIREGHLRLFGGVAAQFTAQYLLLLLCLRATGAAATPGQVLFAYAIGRVVTVIPITPAGLGASETGAGATLVAWGGAAAPTIAGNLLFTMFVVLLEIPVGAACLGVWHLVRRRGQTALAADTEPDVEPGAERQTEPGVERQAGQE